MTKKELIKAIRVANNGNSSTVIEEVVNGMLAVIADELTKDGTVELKSFGTFGTKLRVARKGRNPQTGAEIDLPEKRIAFCKLSKKILD